MCYIEFKIENLSMKRKYPYSSNQERSRIKKTKKYPLDFKRGVLPYSSFIYFCRDEYTNIKSKFPCLPGTSILKKLEEDWINLNSKERQKYNQKERQALSQYLNTFDHKSDGNTLSSDDNE